MEYKVGDRVRVTNDLKFKRGAVLKAGTLMTVVEYHNDGIYKCRADNDASCIYQMLTHQIEKVD